MNGSPTATRCSTSLLDFDTFPSTMLALRSARLLGFLVFSLTVLRSAAQNDTDTSTDTSADTDAGTGIDTATDTDDPPTAEQIFDFDGICQTTAKVEGQDVPTDWDWTVDGQNCTDIGSSP